MAAVEQTGTVTARRQGRPLRSKLVAHEVYPDGLIGAQDDINLEEMRVCLRDEREMMVGLGTLWRFLDAQSDLQNVWPAPSAR